MKRPPLLASLATLSALLVSLGTESAGAQAPGTLIPDTFRASLSTRIDDENDPLFPGDFQGSDASESGEIASANPCYIVFASKAKEFLPRGTTSTHTQIYRRNRCTGKTELVSVSRDSSADTPRPANENSIQPSINAFGNIVAFASNASNIDARDPDSKLDVFLRNMDAPRAYVISLRWDNRRSANDTSQEPDVSGNGDVIAFASRATDLRSQEPFENNGKLHIYKRWWPNNSTTHVSYGQYGVAHGGNSTHPSIDYGGEMVAFQSDAPNLDPQLTAKAGTPQVYVNDGTRTDLVSGYPSGFAAPSGAEDPAISDRGGVVTFTSPDNFGSGRTGTGRKVYLSLVGSSSQPRLISREVTSTGREGDSYHPSISSDGSQIAYTSSSERLGPPTTGTSDTQIYVTDTSTFETRLVSVSTSNEIGNASSDFPSISWDVSGTGGGGYQIVAFESGASNLDPEYLAERKVADNGVTDVYYHDFIGTTQARSIMHHPYRDALRRARRPDRTPRRPPAYRPGGEVSPRRSIFGLPKLEISGRP